MSTTDATVRGEGAAPSVAASVVVPSRGGRQRLPVLLTALAGQATADFEVIVVCDGDIDDSAGLLREWSDRLPLRPIVFDENRGRSAALNAGFAAASGRVLIRCDDDLEPGPDFIAHHVAHHAGDPVGVVGICPDIDTGTTYASVYGNAASDQTEAYWHSLPADQVWRCWSANVSVTRETYALVGDYDERYRRYGWEDVDWGYRLHLAGVPVLIANDVSAWHHEPARTTLARASKAYLSGASRATFAARHGEDVVGRLRPGRGPWGTLVRAVACTLRSESAVLRLARAVDSVAPRLPSPLATKAVALAVEAAGCAGARVRPEA